MRSRGSVALRPMVLRSVECRDRRCEQPLRQSRTLRARWWRWRRHRGQHGQVCLRYHRPLHVHRAEERVLSRAMAEVNLRGASSGACDSGWLPPRRRSSRPVARPAVLFASHTSDALLLPAFFLDRGGSTALAGDWLGVLNAAIIETQDAAGCVGALKHAPHAQRLERGNGSGTREAGRGEGHP